MDTDSHLHPFVDSHADPDCGSHRYPKKLSNIDGILTTLLLSLLSSSRYDRSSLRDDSGWSIALSVFLVFFTVCLTLSPDAKAIPHRDTIVSFTPQNGYFPLSDGGMPALLFISDEEDEGVIRAFRDLQSDIERVTGSRPSLSTDSPPNTDRLIIAGTIGKNPMIDRFVEEGYIDGSALDGHREKFLIQGLDHPLPGIESVLVIAGSDKRGTIFGIYEMSRQIGVSPWFWWADVPVSRQDDLYVNPEPYTIGEPGVKHRGIFINNENPSLLGWVNQRYGGFNHQFYTKVFELILRLQGNYLWPAMWGKAFHDDDPMNAKMANEYGIIIGYTHHEPMMRAHVEWNRYGEGPWDYEKNAENLQEFWREGIERIKDYETTVSLGMRGDGDEPMSDERNIELLERIIDDQRGIIAEHAENPDDLLQYWALYKEVQEYYERGMEVPEDVMLFLANDNWGNIRLLPDPETAHKREGGWGMYYHFDYVGGPRNYKWINTNQISRIWEQMNLAWEHNVNRIWLVNVGDIKPMEFPVSFFLDFAWDPDRIDTNLMDHYPELWAAQQFGPDFAGEIGQLLTEYTRINSRRKPELLTPDTYSLIHFREAQRVVEDYNRLADEARCIYKQLPEAYRDAYYQLVLYPVKAGANLNNLYYTVARNRLYADQGRIAANDMAGRTRELFEKDKELSDYYNYEMAGGKWQHMMDQTRIGYTYWQQPQMNRMPDVEVIHSPYHSSMGVAIEGSEKWWPGASEEAKLPVFDKFHQQSYYIDVFNRNRDPFDFVIDKEASWLNLSESEGRINKQERIEVSVDWEQVPEGRHIVPLTVHGPEDQPVTIRAEVFNPASPERDEINGFVESNGFVSMEAGNYSRSVMKDDIGWKHIPQLGRTRSSMTPFPVLAESRTPGEPDTPRLEYDLHLFSSGEVTVKAYLSPTLNYSKNYRHPDGLRYGISFDDEEPQIVNMHGTMSGNSDTRLWNDWVAANINVRETTHTIDTPGRHTLTFWMMDTGVVLQKIVIETGDIGTTFLGPPESYFNHE